ncbi:MAG: hypothetical protein AAFY88_20415, partial [Acidobacteriota bacterium]
MGASRGSLKNRSVVAGATAGWARIRKTGGILSDDPEVVPPSRFYLSRARISEAAEVDSCAGAAVGAG